MTFIGGDDGDEIDALNQKPHVKLPPLNPSEGRGLGGSRGAGSARSVGGDPNDQRISQNAAASESQQNLLKQSKNPKETFLTDVQVRLAQMEIENPEGTCNTELEDANANYKVVSEELRKQQHIYQEAFNDLQAKRREVEMKEVELLHKKQELESFRARQAEKGAQMAKEGAGLQSAVRAQVENIAGLIDEIKGATTLLQILKQRTNECNVYRDFVFEVFGRLNQGDVYEEEQRAQQYQVSSLERLQASLNAQERHLRSVANQFTRLLKQESRQAESEALLADRQRELLDRARARAEANRVQTAQLEQAIARLNTEAERLGLRFSASEQNTKINNLKLDQKVQEMSNVQSSVKNLCRRVKKLLEERQRALAARAAVIDLLGGRPCPRLERQVDSYYVKTNKILPRNDCYERVLGAKFLKRMRKIYRLGIFLKDLRDLEQICHDYRTSKGKVTIV